MTDRLSTLLHREADSLRVPPAPADDMLRRGRRMRRRRQWGERAGVAVAVGAVIAVAGSMVVGRPSPPTSVEQERFASAPAGVAYRDYGAFAVGSTVYVGNHQKTFEEKVKALFYTSLGVLVRTGEVAHTDDDGPSHYTLVTPDGQTRDIALRMGDRVAATSPDSPYVAFAEPHDEGVAVRDERRWDYVVVTLETGGEIARTTVTGRFTWGGWEAPPVTLSGDRIWGLLDSGWMEWNWRTGETRLLPKTSGSAFEAAGGRILNTTGNGPGELTRKPTWTATDLVTGKDLRTRAMPRDADEMAYFARLSPDGHFVRTSAYLTVGEPSPPSTFVSIESGRAVTLPGGPAFGWTPGGHTLQVDAEADRLTVCDPGTGHCDRIPFEVPSGTLKLGGLSYES